MVLITGGGTGAGGCGMYDSVGGGGGGGTPIGLGTT